MKINSLILLLNIMSRGIQDARSIAYKCTCRNHPPNRRGSAWCVPCPEVAINIWPQNRGMNFNLESRGKLNGNFYEFSL